MKTRTIMGAARQSFAHLLGIKPAAAKSEDNEDDKKDDESAEDEDAEDGDEDDGDNNNNKKSKKAEDDDEESKAEDDDKDDDGDTEEDSDKDGARKAERSRCAHIIAHGIKLGRVEQAGILAFDSDLNAETAINLLSAGAVSEPKKPGGLSARMSSAPQPKVGASGANSSDAPAGAALVISAYNAALGNA